MTIEGSTLAVCPSCARFGVEVNAPPPRRKNVAPAIADRLEARRRRMTPRDVYSQAGEEELALDYADRIRMGRESHGWRQADLGAKINERVTVIAKLESGAMVPNDDLIRRLERALEIKLKEKAPTATVKKAGAREALTLGDLLDLDGEG